MSDIAAPSVMGPSFEVRIRLVFAVLLAGMLIVATAGVLSAWALANAASDVDRVEQAGVALSGILEGMVDQETGVRGFVLTGQEPFLETYAPGGANADDAIVSFDDLTRDLDGVATADDLRRAIASWRDVAEEEIGLVRTGRQDEASAIVESGVAKQRFDIVRAQVNDIDLQLSDIIDARNRRQAVLGRLIAILGVVVLVGALVVIVGLLRWLRRSVTRPLAALSGAVGVADGRTFRAVAGDAAGEVAAVALSADRLRAAKDIERNQAVLVAEQTERERIAADLHDGPVQTLFALQLRMQSGLQRQPVGEADIELLGDAIDVLERTQSDLRSLMFDLTPPGLGDRPLADVIAAVVAEVVEPTTSVRIDVPEDLEIGTAAQLVICRVIVEAVRNAGRHARSTEINVQVRPEGGGVVVGVTDDGVGFDVDDEPDDGHFGVGIMRSLVESIGGTLVMSSVPGVGTDVRVVVP